MRIYSAFSFKHFLSIFFEAFSQQFRQEPPGCRLEELVWVSLFRFLGLILLFLNQTRGSSLAVSEQSHSSFPKLTVASAAWGPFRTILFDSGDQIEKRFTGCLVKQSFLA